MTTALQPHGTIAARSRHLRNGEKPCTACYAAHAAYQRAHNARKQQRRHLDQAFRDLIGALAALYTTPPDPS